MSRVPRVFVDSDVIISSLLSASGAAHLLLSKNPNADYYISDFSLRELKVVAKRMEVPEIRLQKLMENVLRSIKISTVHSKFREYTTDLLDAHIVAGAVKARARFIITYNDQRHFRADQIKQDFGIILMTPAQFLQYLRQ